MLGRAKEKYIKSLQVKKNRRREQKFVVEGGKSVCELIHSYFKIDSIFCTTEYSRAILDHLPIDKNVEIVQVTPEALTRMSYYQTNHEALAIAHIPTLPKPMACSKGYTLVLDNIQDPGNLGTIMRIADWYGISLIIASQHTTDVYSQKVINASMGSFCRVAVHYLDLPQFLSSVDKPIYGTFLRNGINLHQVDFKKDGLLIMGNESNGITRQIEKWVIHKISIPKYGKAESLNVAVAAGIVLDTVFRSTQ